MDFKDSLESVPWSRLKPFQIGYLFLVVFSIFGLLFFSQGWSEISLDVSSNVVLFLGALSTGVLLMIPFHIIERRLSHELTITACVILVYTCTSLIVRYSLVPDAGDFNTLLPLAFLAFSGTQGFFLGSSLAIFQKRVVPSQERGYLTDSEWKKYLDIHLQNWWRVGELFLTIGLVIGASLLLKVVPHPLSHKGKWVITLLGFPFAAQIVIILGFIRAKMVYVEENLSG